MWLTTAAFSVLRPRKRDHISSNCQRNIDFKLVIFPTPTQAFPGENIRRVGAQALNLADLDYPSKRLSQFALQNSISYPDLLAPFRAYGDREGILLYGFPPHLGDGHLNETGNKLGGELIADWLCPQLSLSASFADH